MSAANPSNSAWSNSAAAPPSHEEAEDEHEHDPGEHPEAVEPEVPADVPYPDVRPGRCKEVDDILTFSKYYVLMCVDNVLIRLIGEVKLISCCLDKDKKGLIVEVPWITPTSVICDNCP